VNKLFAIGLACCLPAGFAAQDPTGSEFLPATVNVLVIEESAPIAKDVLCTRGAFDKAAHCMTVNRAVLTARMQRVPARERGRWM